MTFTDAPINGSSSSEPTIKPVKEAFWAIVKLPKNRNKLNTNYNVKGALTYSYGAYKLLPRNSNDVSVFVSILEKNNEVLKLYPNPLNQTNLNITIENNSIVSLFNLSGQLIKTYQLKSGNNSVNLDFLKKGLYMIKCNSKTYTIAKT